jgi:predicted SAM-dependent methyltransferase
MTPELTKLNMGCGFKKLIDHWNVDIESKCNPDQVVDLEQTPWPYEDNFFDRITADNILEHLGQNPRVFTNIIKEMYRVSQNQAEWFIKVPHHRCDLFWDDYTHVRPLTAKTFRMFDQQFNFDTIKRNLSESTYGIYHSVDLEIYDVTYNIIDYWRAQQEQGLLGHKQLDLNLNTMSNVCETVNIFIKVHKPGRCETLIQNHVRN